MSEFGVPQRRKRFIVIATRERLAEEIFVELENGRDHFMQARGLGLRNSAYSALSDIEFQTGNHKIAKLKRIYGRCCV